VEEQIREVRRTPLEHVRNELALGVRDQPDPHASALMHDLIRDPATVRETLAQHGLEELGRHLRLGLVTFLDQRFGERSERQRDLHRFVQSRSGRLPLRLSDLPQAMARDRSASETATGQLHPV